MKTITITELRRYTATHLRLLTEPIAVQREKPLRNSKITKFIHLPESLVVVVPIAEYLRMQRTIQLGEIAMRAVAAAAEERPKLKPEKEEVQ